MANLSKAFKELSEKLGMSVDEIAEAFGKKQGKAHSVPVGSGKNLKELQKAKVGARDLDEVRAYPKNITQDELAARDNFKLVGEPQTKDFTIVPEGTQVPVMSSGTSAVSGVPQPKNALSSVSPIIDDIPGSSFSKNMDDINSPRIGYNKNADIPDAEIIEKINKMPEGPLKTSAIKKYAPWLLTGAIGTGMLFNQPGQESAPSATFTSPKINGAPADDIDKQIPKTMVTEGSKEEESQASKLSRISDEEMAKLPQEKKSTESDRLAYMEMMQNAQKSASQNQLSAALLKAGMQAGAAIAGPGVKMDTSVADALAASSDKPVSNVKGLMETEATSKKLDELERQEKEESDLKDPDSEISKFYREKFGPFIPGITKNTSAFAMQKALPQLTQLINVKEAAESRKQSRAEAAAEKEERSKESNKFKAQASVDKQVSQLYKSKDYEAYTAAKDAQVALDSAIASGDKTEAGTAFMQFGKIAQGDNSVLRDGDMVMLAGGYDYTSVVDMLSKLRARAKGGRFNDTELNQMKKIAERVGQLKGQRVQQLFSPIVERAQANDLNLLEHFDPAQIQEFSGKSSQSNELTTNSNTRTFKSSYAPGSIVTTKSGSTYKIGEDGKTGTKLNE